MLGVVMAKGHNVVNVGEELDAALRRISNVLPVGVQFDKISDQPAVVTKAVSEFLEALGEALFIVLAVSLFSLGWRAGHRRRLDNPARSRCNFSCHVYRWHRLAAHFAWRAHYSPGTARRRRDDRSRDDGAEARRRLRQTLCCLLCVQFHGIPNAHRYAHYDRRLCPRWLRRQHTGRICADAVLGDRGLAYRIVVCRGLLYAMAWLHAAQGAGSA